VFADDFGRDFRNESGNPRVKQTRFRFCPVLRRCLVWGLEGGGQGEERERQREREKIGNGSFGFEGEGSKHKQGGRKLEHLYDISYEKRGARYIYIMEIFFPPIKFCKMIEFSIV